MSYTPRNGKSPIGGELQEQPAAAAPHSFPPPRHRRLKHLLAAVSLLFLVIGTVYVLRRHNAPTWHAAEGPVFGTYYHVKYRAAADLHMPIRAELARLDSTFSLFNPSSLLSRLNANTTDTTDALMRQVFRLARHVSQSTHGAFDITVAPLVKAWGFGPDGVGESPGESTLDSLRAFVGIDRVSVNGIFLRKSDPRVQLDFSAVAKGFAVDRIAAVLRAAGVEDFMVEIGGEVVAQGANPEGNPWTVGIVKPTTEDATAGLVEQVVTLGTGAMATSGNYLNYHKEGHRRIGHTIDPRTGRPVEHTLLSATVFAPTCAAADAYATAFMVLGLDSARTLVQNSDSLGAFLIYEDATGHHVWAFPDKLTR